MAKIDKNTSVRLQQLLEHVSSVTGLRICFHDGTRRGGLPVELSTHTSSFCKKMKQLHFSECVLFDAHETHVALEGNPHGRIQTCPFGATEIVVPVIYNGQHGGTIFAGQCRTSPEVTDQEDLITPPNPQWLRERLTLMEAVAHMVAELLKGKDHYVPDDRRDSIISFLHDGMERTITLAELAGHLRLSASRTGHLIKELFGITFPLLVRRIKMREAAHYLTTTDFPVGYIAGLVGYEDQNYFSRQFSKHFQMSPLKYRRKFAVEA